jgi:hypothetical protein
MPHLDMLEFVTGVSLPPVIWSKQIKARSILLEKTLVPCTVLYLSMAVPFHVSGPYFVKNLCDCCTFLKYFKAFLKKVFVF